MPKAIKLLFLFGILVCATPASAQYAFDWRVDPQVCRWTETCDYGGRAYAWAHHRHWHHRARVVAVRHRPWRPAIVQLPRPWDAVPAGDVIQCGVRIHPYWGL